MKNITIVLIIIFALSTGDSGWASAKVNVPEKNQKITVAVSAVCSATALAMHSLFNNIRHRTKTVIRIKPVVPPVRLSIDDDDEELFF